MITFTESQVAQLGALTVDGAANFAEGYAFLHSVISSLTEAELLSMGSSLQEAQNSLYWLARATEINSNDLDSQANQFIRDVTRYGLVWDGLPAGSIQFNSDEIGRAVVGGILGSNNMMPIEQIVGLDVAAAIEDGGQTVGGWGGAFYYWDAPYTIPETGITTTIGGYILSHTGELEKFIAVASMASFNAVAQALANGVGTVDDVLSILESFWNIAATGAVSQLPLDIRLTIANEVRDLAMGESSVFNAIDMSNAYSYRTGGPGLNGAEIDLVAGAVVGFISHEENFRFIGSTITQVRATEHGDWVNVRDAGVAGITVHGLGGDDTVALHGGTVIAYGDAGNDQAGIDGDWDDFNITKIAGDYVLSSRSGPSKHYTMSGFETFVFGDGLRAADQLLNEAPTDIAWAPGGGHVAENLAIGATVGTVLPTDANPGDAFTYAIVGGGTGWFAIDAQTGVVSASRTFDYETATSSWISVKVTDSGGLSFTNTLNIAIDDVSPIINAPPGGYVSGTSSYANGTDENDRMYGTSFNDYFFAGIGDDIAFGYGGDDIFQDPNPGHGNDTYDGGSGSDTVSYLGTGAIEINLTAGTAIGGYAGNDILISIENASTWKGNDKLTGNSGANRLKGGEGSDQIWGLAGNDQLLGGFGADILYGGAGNDFIYGHSDTNPDSYNDTAVFGGSVSQYDFELYAPNTAWLSVSGPDGFDWTHDIAIYKFDDATLTRQQIEAAWL